MVRHEQIDESMALIRKALAVAPGKEEYTFTLAQLYLQKHDFKAASLILEPIARNGADSQMRQHAQSLLDQVTAFEKQISGLNESGEREPPALNPKARKASEETAEVDIDPLSYLREALRKPAADEVQAQGILVRIDCSVKAIVFSIQTAERLLKVQSENFEKLELKAFTNTAGGEITCGVRKNQDVVVVTYKAGAVPRAKTDGTAISLEFVPKEFKLKP
jgi:hypothetical protein